MASKFDSRTIKVTLYMTVNDNHARWYGAHSMLWHKDMHLYVVPTRGERLMLWEDGPMVEVLERWWDHRGICFVGLCACVVDPDSDEQRYQANALTRTNWSWFTEQQGPLRGRLIDGGWTTSEGT